MADLPRGEILCQVRIYLVTANLSIDVLKTGSSKKTFLAILRTIPWFVRGNEGR